MSKRKQSGNDDDSNDDSSSDVTIIDVDFDFYDPDPAVDYLALKRLLGQLFQTDAEFFHLHDLAELILNQPSIGTTVKTNGTESDPYAFLTVLNIHIHHEHPSIKAIAKYALEKTSSASPPFHATLQSLLSNPQSHVGFVFCERLINMPVQVIPPMYTLLSEELKSAVRNGEPYAFTHFLFISRTYHLTPQEESTLFNSSPSQPRTPSKKSKLSNASTSQTLPALSPDRIYPFHLEDEYIKLLSMHTLDYKFTTAPSEPREKDAFGLDIRGRMMLLSADRLSELVAKMNEAFAPS